MSTGRIWLFRFALLVSVLAGVEIASYLAGRLLETRGVYYRPGRVDGYADYLRDRHPVLGWTVQGSAADELDGSGARRVPGFPASAQACVSLYGDSMTWSAEVGPEESWASVLSRLLECRVASYGVGGYGSDQALLRFELMRGRDDAPIVVLGHLTENILRNVNQYRALLYPGSRFGFKPRFVVDPSGALELVPLPSFSPDEFERLARDPASFLSHEYFRLHERVHRLRFPYSRSILAAFADFRVRAELARRPGHGEFYDPAHPSGALQVTAGILARFDAEARADGRLPLPLVIPIGPDFQYFERTGEWIFQPLLDALAERQVDAFNVGPPMLAALTAGRDPCELVSRGCSGHFTAEGYALLAAAVRDELVRRHPRIRAGL